MKQITFRFFPCLLLVFFLIGTPIFSNAAIVPPPVEKTKTNKRQTGLKKKRIKRQQRIKKASLKSIQGQNKTAYHGMIVGGFLLFAGIITGIVLLIVGLVNSLPVLWIVGLCLLGISILIALIWFAIFNSEMNNMGS